MARLSPCRILLAAALLSACSPSAGSGPLGLPDQVAFSLVEGGPDPAPIALTVSNTGTCPLLLTASSSTVDGGAWLPAPVGATVLASSSVQVSISVQASVVGLTPATWTGAVIFEATCADTGQPAVGSPVDVSVNVTVVTGDIIFPVSGTVAGLQGTGLQIEETYTSAYSVMDVNAPFGFAVLDGASYNVVVASQPSNPTQLCTVTNGTGVVNGGPVTNVEVICAGGCPTDPYEPDDSLSVASALPTLATDLEGCSDNDDWFSADLATWTSLDVAIAFDHDEGNLDLNITDDSGDPLATADSTTDDEALLWVPEEGPATYFVQVSMTGPDTGLVPGSPYSIFGAVACSPDAYEPNEFSFDAPSLASGTYSVTWCADEDWFLLPSAPWEEVSVEAAFSNDEGNIDLSVIDQYANVLDASAGSGDGETVTFVAPGSDAQLQVTMADAGEFPGNGYELAVSMECVVDSTEPNDSPAAAASLTLPIITEENALCAGDVDWFAIDLAGGDLLDVIVNIPLGIDEGDVALELQDLAGNQLAYTNTADTVEYLSYTSGPSQTVRLGVILLTDGGDWDGQGYTMDVFTGPAEICYDDFLEPNDSLAAASPMIPSSYPGLHLCPSNPDWYGVDLTAGSNAVVNLWFQAAEGNLDLFLYTASSTVVASSTSSSDDEALDYLVPADGTYYIKVELTSDAGFTPGTPYDLEVISES